MCISVQSLEMVVNTSGLLTVSRKLQHVWWIAGDPRGTQHRRHRHSQTDKSPYGTVCATLTGHSSVLCCPEVDVRCLLGKLSLDGLYSTVCRMCVSVQNKSLRSINNSTHFLLKIKQETKGNGFPGSLIENLCVKARVGFFPLFFSFCQA